LKGAAVTAAAMGTGTLAGCRTRTLRTQPPRSRDRWPRHQGQRVAIVGGGAGGITAAHFLAGSYAIDLFEARDKLGGHCDSRTISYQGQEIAVDMARSSSTRPRTRCTSRCWKRWACMTRPAGDDLTLEAAGSLCLFPVRRRRALFSSSNPLATPSGPSTSPSIRSWRARRCCRTCPTRSPSISGSACFRQRHLQERPVAPVDLG